MQEGRPIVSLEAHREDVVEQRGLPTTKKPCQNGDRHVAWLRGHLDRLVLLVLVGSGAHWHVRGLARAHFQHSRLPRYT